jgi:hypothetical protein
MAFSQYCSFCEKLMDSRHASALYCSDECKQADAKPYTDDYVAEEKAVMEEKRQSVSTVDSKTSDDAASMNPEVRSPISIQTTTTITATSYRVNLSVEDDTEAFVRVSTSANPSNSFLSPRDRQSPRSIDLIAPSPDTFSPLQSLRGHDSSTLMYEKKIVPTASPNSGSLQNLLEKK